jgi:hypothetical protein
LQRLECVKRRRRSLDEEIRWLTSPRISGQVVELSRRIVPAAFCRPFAEPQHPRPNLVGDLQLYNTAAELTRIMGHKNASRFFNDPSAVNPQTVQFLHPPPAPPSPPPDPKLLAMQARAQTDAATAAHQAQLQLHQEISGQGYGYYEIRQIVTEMFGK